MRRLVPCLILLAALPALAACGSSSPAKDSVAATTATAPGAPRFDRTQLAACLERQGVTLPRPADGTPSPLAGGRRPRGRGFGFFRNVPPARRAKLQAALRKCGARFGLRRFGQGRFAANDPRYRAALTKFVACVRRHGFNLPAPNTSGTGPVFDPRKVNRDDPKLVAASRACQGLLRPAP